MSVCQIDLKKPLESQGHFDVLVHKITDLIAEVVEGHESSEASISELEVSCETLSKFHHLLVKTTHRLSIPQCSGTSGLHLPHTEICHFCGMNVVISNSISL